MRVPGWVKWSGAAAGVLVVAALAVLGIGMMLPVSHTATVTAHLDASPEAVWTLFVDIDRFPEWRSGIERVERVEDAEGRVAWRESGSEGALTFAAETWDPPRRLVTRIQDEGLPFGGSWEYELAPDGACTRVTLTERGEIYDPVYRFFGRFVFGTTTTMERYLEDAADAIGPAG